MTMPRLFVPPNPFINNLGRSVSTPMVNFGYNRFDPNVPLPTQPTVPTDNPVNFADEYAKITGNRPNRLAYQQAVEQGSPDIQRGNWARLGAALTAGLTGAANPRDPGGAYSLAMSAYQEPQRRADEDYDKKLRGLANLAQFEESDKANEIRALEMRQNDYYKQQENIRQNKAELRAADLTQAQIDNYRADNERANWMKYDDATDGNTYLYNQKTGEKRLVAKTGLTTEEQVKAKLDALDREMKLKEPYEIAKDLRERRTRESIESMGNKSASDIADKQIAGRESVARIKADAAAKVAAARLREKVATMKPDDIAKNMALKMATEIEEGRLPADAPAYLKWVNGVPTSETPGMDWVAGEEGAATQRKVQEFVGNYIKGAQSGQGGGENKTETPKGKEAELPDVKVPEGRIAIYDKNGKPVGHVPANQREQAIAQGYRVK